MARKQDMKRRLLLPWDRVQVNKRVPGFWLIPHMAYLPSNNDVYIYNYIYIYIYVYIYIWIDKIYILYSMYIYIHTYIHIHLHIHIHIHIHTYIYIHTYIHYLFTYIYIHIYIYIYLYIYISLYIHYISSLYCHLSCLNPDSSKPRSKPSCDSVKMADKYGFTLTIPNILGSITLYNHQPTIIYPTIHIPIADN